MMIYVLQSGNETKPVTDYIVYMIHLFFAYIYNIQLSQLLISIKKDQISYIVNIIEHKITAVNIILSE